MKKYTATTVVTYGKKPVVNIWAEKANKEQTKASHKKHSFFRYTYLGKREAATCAKCGEPNPNWKGRNYETHWRKTINS